MPMNSREKEQHALTWYARHENLLIVHPTWEMHPVDGLLITPLGTPIQLVEFKWREYGPDNSDGAHLTLHTASTMTSWAMILECLPVFLTDVPMGDGRALLATVLEPPYPVVEAPRRSQDGRQDDQGTELRFNIPWETFNVLTKYTP